MSITKLFAQDPTALDDRMDQLVEVLAQLLEENGDASTGTADQEGSAELHSDADRAIHVVVNNQEK